MNVAHLMTARTSDSTEQMVSFVVLILLGVLVLVGLALWITSMVSVLRSTYSPSMKLVFVLAILALPFAGPLAWFVVVRKHQPGVAPLPR